MKKPYIISLTFLLLLVVACAELEEEPKSQLFAKGFTDSPATVSQAVAGMYKRIISNNNPWEVALGSTRFRAAFCGADDYTSKTGSNKQDWVNADIFAFKTTPLSGTMGGNNWGVPWSGILQANWILTSEEALKYYESETEDNQKYINTMLAEARVWRAWCYFYLVRMFGPVPIIETHAYIPEKHLSVGAEQVESVYNFIERDIRWAVQHGAPASSNIKQSRITKEAAEAFMAEFALTRAGWPLKQTNYYDTARVYAERVIGSNKFRLHDSFYDLFDPVNEDNEEYIWQLNFCLNSLCNSAGGNVFGQKGTKPIEIAGGFSDLFIENTFANNFPEGPRKKRSLVSTYNQVVGNDTVKLNFSVEHAYLSKFWGNSYDSTKLAGENSGAAFSDMDWPMIRLAEVYFIYAEAQAMSQGSPSPIAYDYINQIRRRGAGLPLEQVNAGVDLPAGMSSSEFQAEILKERGWELLGEMQRWFDLTRLEKVEEVTKNRDTKELPLTNAAPLPGNGLSIGDPYYYLKPTEDIEQNPNLENVNTEILTYN